MALVAKPPTPMANAPEAMVVPSQVPCTLPVEALSAKNTRKSVGPKAVQVTKTWSTTPDVVDAATLGSKPPVLNLWLVKDPDALLATTMKPSRNQVTNVRPPAMYMSGVRLSVPTLAKTRSGCQAPEMYFVTMRSDGPGRAGDVVRDQIRTGVNPLKASVGLPSSMLLAVVVTRRTGRVEPAENSSVWANSPPGPTCSDHTPNHWPSRAMTSPVRKATPPQVSTVRELKTPALVLLPMRISKSLKKRT